MNIIGAEFKSDPFPFLTTLLRSPEPAYRTTPGAEGRLAT
jgi:hypothetical protein